MTTSFIKKIKKNKIIYLNYSYSVSLSSSVIKYASDIKINKLDIINQKTDKINFLGELKNFNKFFTKGDCEMFLSHGILKTDYLMQFFYKDFSKPFEKKFSTYNTITSAFQTFGLKNYKIGNQINNPTKNQYINLNKSLYTDNDNIIIDLNDVFYSHFYNHYLNNKLPGIDLNRILLNKMYKYQECYNLIDINYKNSCIQAVNVLYLKNEYVFEVISLL